MGILKDKSAYVTILENYPVEVLKTDLLHFVRDQKACMDKTVLDQLVCDIDNERDYACASTLNDKHASPKRQECISGGGRKRVYGKDTFEGKDRSSEGHKRLKHCGSDASPSNSYDGFHHENYLDIQTDNLNNDIQNTTAHGSSDKECRQVSCNRGEEILPLSNDSESTSNGDGQYGENAENEVHVVRGQMSEFEDNSDDKKGGNVESEDLPPLDHLLLDNDCCKQVCLKCRKGGPLSYCNGCGFAAHDKCLQSYVSIMSGGNVSCPACSYKSALSDFNKMKERALEFKKTLLAFIHVDAVQVNGQKSPDRSSRKMEIFPDTENTYKDPASHLTPDDLGFKKKDPPLYSRSCETFVHENEIPIGIGNSHPFSKYAYNGDHDDHEASIAKEKKSRLRHRKSPVMKNGYDGGHDGDNEAGDAGNSKYDLRHKKLQMRGSSRLPGGVRRIKLPWTKEEEKILKEGMQKFAPIETNSIPWKHILEHGKGVFNKSRNAIDLKDKWRNMKKGSS